MAYSHPSLTSSIIGKESTAILSKALLAGKSLNSGLVTVYPGIKSKLALRKFNATNILQADSCDFTLDGTITASESMLDPTKLKVNVEFCISQYEQYWASAMVNGTHNSDITFKDYIIEHFSKAVAQSIEQHIWAGDTAGSFSKFDGFAKILGAADVTGTTLTAGNVIAEVTKVYIAIPEAVKETGNAYIVMSYAGATLYRQAIASLNSGSPMGNLALDIYGTPIYGTSIATNTIIAGTAENFAFGTDLESDFNEVKLIDMRETTGDDKLRLVMKLQAGVAIVERTDAVLYK